MSHSKFQKAYDKYYSDRDNEQLELFQLLDDRFAVTRVLYPGSYVHVTPSFVFPDVTYVDNDKKAMAILVTTDVVPFVTSRKVYEGTPNIVFHPQSYTDAIEEPLESFDLILSLWAGFISIHCKKYLKRGGLLLVNNSHGDAGMAFIDPDFKLVGVIDKRKDRYVHSDKGLEQYFIPKKPQNVSKERLLELGRGIGYKKAASLYLFKKI